MVAGHSSKASEADPVSHAPTLISDCQTESTRSVQDEADGEKCGGGKRRKEYLLKPFLITFAVLLLHVNES